jgi:asparagine synthase (glutamine-hydrolysing)
MAYSTEWREPYLDHRLVEFCFFLPEELKIKDGTQKYLLREAMKKVVPGRAKENPKKTFGAVQTPWFRKFLKDEIMGILESKSFGSRRYWDQDKVLKEASRFFRGEGDNSFYVWQWLNLEFWFRKFID